MSQAPKTYPRPLSPHLQIYKPQLTSILSITHRLTGIGLYFGVLVLAVWLFAMATSPECFAWLQSVLGSFVGRCVLFAWAFALFYHLCNGIRHLVWDAGYGFELREAYDSGGMIIVGSVLLTVLAWFMAYGLRGPDFWANF